MSRRKVRVPSTYVPWQDPRSITELTLRRVRGYAMMYKHHRAFFGPVLRSAFTLHRKSCEIVAEQDDDLDCTCVPLVLYTGATA